MNIKSLVVFNAYFGKFMTNGSQTFSLDVHIPELSFLIPNGIRFLLYWGLHVYTNRQHILR